MENKKEMFTTIFQWDRNEKKLYITGNFCNWLQFFEIRKFKKETKQEKKVAIPTFYYFSQEILININLK